MSLDTHSSSPSGGTSRHPATCSGQNPTAPGAGQDAQVHGNGFASTHQKAPVQQPSQIIASLPTAEHEGQEDLQGWGFTPSQDSTPTTRVILQTKLSTTQTPKKPCQSKPVQNKLSSSTREAQGQQGQRWGQPGVTDAGAAVPALPLCQAQSSQRHCSAQCAPGRSWTDTWTGQGRRGQC